MIDYACGAGHFLTEGIEAINDIQHKRRDKSIPADNRWVRDCIYGIEKDYRLARVSKIALFMNGAGDANIIFGDGLDNDPAKGIENGKFDILVANPPYSVSAFKAHLKLQHNDLELLPSISNNSGEIETLFVERIGQLLKSGGLAGVFLPSTILSASDKSGYEEAREQILSNFYLRAVVCFGGRTFGATSTNTIVLFMERFHEPPVQKQLAIDTANSILSGNDNSDWNDSDILNEYLSLIGVTAEQYKSFVSETASMEDLCAIEYFKPYVLEFENTQQKFPRNYTLEQIEQERKDRLYKRIRDVEKDKLIYFTLVRGQETVVITAPADNAEQKTFLGYDWSNRKGREGIVLSPNGGYLTNEKNRFAHGTLATFVRNAFRNMRTEMGEETTLQKYVASYRTIDMLDFSRTKFDKTIKTALDKKIIVRSKYTLVTLADLCEMYQPKTISGNEIKTEGEYKVYGANGVIGYYDKFNHEESEVAMTCRGATCGTINYTEPRSWITGNAMVITPKDNRLLKLYLKEYLTNTNVSHIITGSAQPQITRTNLNPLQIPLPPIDVQEQIVAECQKVDEEYNTSRMAIEDYRKKIAQAYENLQVIGADKRLKLNNFEVFEIGIGKRVLNSEVSPEFSIPVYSANVFEPFGMIDRLLLTDFSKDSVLWGIDGDWMVNTIPANTPFFPTDHCGVLRIKTNDIEPKYMAYLLQKEGERVGFNRSYRASIDRIEGLTVEVAPIEEQRKAVAQVEQYEAAIRQAQAIMDGCSARKKAILDKYLN